MFGYHGRYFRLDLTHRRAESISVDEDVLRRFLGGVGLGSYLLHRESTTGHDPLAAESPLIFALSPLVGTPLTTSAKFAVVAKSPLTNRINDALSSSHFALAAKRAGCDAIVVAGRCPQLSVALLDETGLRVESAPDLAGLPAQEAQARLRERHGPEWHWAVIGPAGENLVRFATISHDNRHAGRGGLGAVMGSKNLKALGVSGSARVPLADPSAVVELARDLSERSFGPATAKYRELGTVANLLTLNRFEALPTRNFQQGSSDSAQHLSGEKLHSEHPSTRASCASCTIGCEHIFEGSTGPVRLEYESLFALGSLCGIDDRDIVLRAAKLCDELGMDTISTGVTLAFAMECVEQGLLDADVRFGDGETMLATLADIATRKGVGDRLAEGTRRLAEELGEPAPSFAPHVKGLEIPGYEPRALQTMALGFAVGTRGADHNRSGGYEADFSSSVNRTRGDARSARHAIETEDKAALMDSLILCKFLRGVFEDFHEESANLLRAVTGWDITADELRETAQRIVTAKKLYNIREGWTPNEDTLPPRFLEEALPTSEGDVTLTAERLDEMKRAYHQGRGWTEAGYLPEGLVRSLGLRIGESSDERE